MTPEFSRTVFLEKIEPYKPKTETLTATPEECAALARRFDLREVSGLTADVTCERTADGKLIRISGVARADVVQACVVSLQDVPGEVEARFESIFTETGDEMDADESFDIDLGEDDNPVGGNGVVDIGELVAQYVALELDPYPRAPGVSLAAQMAKLGSAGAAAGPFQVLEGLKDKESDSDTKKQTGESK